MRLRGRFLVLLLSLSAVIVTVLAPSGAFAQALPTDRTGLSVSPPTFNLTANPGDTLHNSIRVDNVTDGALSVQVEVRNFAALGEEGQVKLEPADDDSTFSLAKWIKVSPVGANIPAHGSQTFDYTVSVPQNAEPGGRFGSIVFKTKAVTVNNSAVAVSQEIGTLLLLRTAGSVHEKASILTFKSNHSVFESGPIGLETRIKNSGDVHIKPTGTITFSNVLGRKIASIPFDSRNILPTATRRFDSQWKNHPLIGRYTATLSIVYGDSRQAMSASTAFYIIPYRLIAAVLAVLLVIGFVVWRVRGRLGRAFRILAGKD